MQYELYHHGILGMKWGIRRYQNKDGTWTAAGKKRYGGNEHALEVDRQIQKYTKASNRQPLTLKGINKQEFDKMPNRSERDFDASIQAQKDELLKDAKEKGMFEMTFVEAIQNDYDDSNMTEEQEEKDVLARYENYLESPSNWLKVNNEYHGLSVEKVADKIYDRMMKDSGGFDKIDDPELYELMIMEYTEDLRTAGLNPEPIIDKAKKRFEPNELRHYGILGMKWGIRRYQNPDGSLTPAGRRRLERKDLKWAKKNYSKIEKKAYKRSTQELYDYKRKELDPVFGKNYSRSFFNAWNQKMAEVMTKNASDIKAPSGRSVKFVAKRAEYGVMMALADENYDMSQFKRGVWSSGRIAYKKKTVDINH